jgi:phosphatidylserine synthase
MLLEALSFGIFPPLLACALCELPKFLKVSFKILFVLSAPYLL